MVGGVKLVYWRSSCGLASAGSHGSVPTAAETQYRTYRFHRMQGVGLREMLAPIVWP